MDSIDINLYNFVVKKKHLELIKNNINHSQRIQNRIDAFCNDIIAGDGSVDYIEDILISINHYLNEFEDDDLCHAVIKINEAIFYLGNFMHS